MECLICEIGPVNRNKEAGYVRFTFSVCICLFLESD